MKGSTRLPCKLTQFHAFSGVLLLFLMAQVCRAQDGQLPPPPLPSDPTPLNQLLTTRDKQRLDQAHGPKNTVEAYLDISDLHLDTALSTMKGGDSGASERELDVYRKTVTECARFAFAQQEGKRGLSKKIEQRLYKQIKALESLIVLFPAERVQFAEAALGHAKQLRVQSLNESFAAGDVLKESDADKKPEKPPAEKKTGQMNFAPNRITLGSQIGADYLTDEEDEQVRQAQKPDDRMKVFMKIADRRLEAINGVAPAADKKGQKKAEDEQREWGSLPKLTRAQLLKHYARAISEAMAKLEDAYERNPKSTVLPKALTVLREATDRHLATLHALESELKEDSDLRALREALDQAETANNGAKQGLNKQ